MIDNEERCETCHFWRGFKCRINPPQELPYAMHGVWPETFASEWCGKWKLKRELVPPPPEPLPLATRIRP